MVWYNPRTWGAPALPAPAAKKGRKPIVGSGTPVERKTKGWAGSRVAFGVLSDHESNPALRRGGWPRAEREMRRTEASVGAIWRATRDSLLSARWSWRAGDSTDPVSRRLADEANRLFGLMGYGGRMRRPWENALEQAILFYPVGWRYGEVRFELTEWGIDIVDPWVDREPIAHDRWVFDEQDDWIGVIQKAPSGDLGRALGSGTGPFIPAEELVLLAHGVEGQNLEGCGALRPAWDTFERKRAVQDFQMEAVERWSRGIPEIVIDEVAAEEAGVSKAELKKQVERVRASITAFLAGDAAWIESTPYVRVQTFGGELDPSKASSLIESLDGAIKSTMLLQFLNLGTTPTGSRAVGEVHHDLWRTSLCQVLDRVSAAYGGHRRAGGGVIGRWVELNYPSVTSEQLPRLVHAGLSVDPLVDALGQLPALTAAGWVDPANAADREKVRHRIGLGVEHHERMEAPPVAAAPIEVRQGESTR